MTKVDFFGHWFYFFLFMGMLLLQAKDYRGWAFRFAGEVGWIGIGLVIGMSSVWLWGFAFLVVDVLGYFKWQKEQEELADLEREQTEWVESAGAYVPSIFEDEFSVDYDPGYEYVKDIANGKDKTAKRESEGPQVAARSRKATNRKVRPARGRRSKPANGKRRSGSNDEPRSKKSVPRKPRVQKDSSRSRTRRTRSGKA